MMPSCQEGLPVIEGPKEILNRVFRRSSMAGKLGSLLKTSSMAAAIKLSM